MALSSPTLGDLIDAVVGQLNGWLAAQDQMTTLNGAITDTATTISVDDATQISAGPIEIDTELIWVTSVDRTNNTVTVAPWGRGYLHTVAVAHSDNAKVVSHPRFPRARVMNAIQETLYSVYPDLFVVKDDVSNTVVPVQISYPVAADCDLVLHVGWKAPGPTGLEVTARRWRFNTQTQKVDIFDSMDAGQTVRITYMAQPTQLITEADALSLSGLPDSVQDVLIFGACYRMVPALEVARLDMNTVGQTANAQAVQSGAATNVDRYYFGLYEQALEREAVRLQKYYPTQSHMER